MVKLFLRNVLFCYEIYFFYIVDICIFFVEIKFVSWILKRVWFENCGCWMFVGFFVLVLFLSFVGFLFVFLALEVIVVYRVGFIMTILSVLNVVLSVADF